MDVETEWRNDIDGGTHVKCGTGKQDGCLVVKRCDTHCEGRGVARVLPSRRSKYE